eukprot:SAG31_NODE_3426_length_4289_cov_14.374702_1_plen_78_part_00
MSIDIFKNIRSAAVSLFCADAKFRTRVRTGTTVRTYSSRVRQIQIVQLFHKILFVLVTTEIAARESSGQYLDYTVPG